MLIFIDTEFSDFINTQLISIGLLSQSEESICAELPFDRQVCSNFVKSEVLPLLGHIKGAQCTPDKLGVRLRGWLEQLKTDNANVLIFYDYAANWTFFFDALNNDLPAWIRA